MLLDGKGGGQMPVKTTRLTETRLQLHCATRLIGSFGYKAIAHVPRYLQRSLTWQPDPGIFFTQIIPAPEPFRAGIDLSTAELVTIQGSTLELARTPLKGATIASIDAWLRDQALSRGMDEGVLSPMDRDDLGAHPVLTGAAFTADADSLATFAELLTVSSEAFAKMRVLRPRASASRFWPHRLDLALGITKGDPSDHHAPTVTVGFSLGDHNYPDPYWYQTISPVPKGITNLTLVEGRHWHSDGWTGVVLPYATYLALGSDLEARKFGLEVFVIGTAGSLWDRIK